MCEEDNLVSDSILSIFERQLEAKSQLMVWTRSLKKLRTKSYPTFKAVTPADL